MSRCKECGSGPRGPHKKGCLRYLEIEADRILMADRHEHCDTLACKQHFYLDGQYERRKDREVPWVRDGH